MEKKITDKEVAGYLIENPSFFTNRDDLLVKIKIPHKKRGAVSLVEKQLEVLRERQMVTNKTINEFVENAARNKDIFDKSHKLVLDLVSAKHISEFCSALENSLKHGFGCRTNSLILFGQKKRTNRFVSQVPLKTAKDRLDDLMQRDAPTLGILSSKQLEFLFNEQSPEVKSAAVLTLRDENTHLGILAIGSERIEYFTRDMDTLFVEFIASALEKLLPMHLEK